MPIRAGQSSAVDVFVTTLGCRLNEAEIDSWSRQLGDQGHRVVANPELAQVMVVNTCAVTSEAARKSRKLISGIQRKNPEAKLVLTGCFSELEPERAAQLAGVDLVVPNVDKERLVQVVSERLDLSAMPASAASPEVNHAFREARTRGFVKVQDGCRNRCTFCIVTIARGRERSRTIDDVVAEVQLLVNRGYQEVVLTGVHLGGYGSELGTDLRALTYALLERTDVGRLRLSSLEPWDLPDNFAELWQQDRLMPHLHLPLQSGSDAVLRRMARRCSRDEYRRLVAELRNSIDGLVITTDVIVGFPGESDEEWRHSIDFVREIGFAHVHAFSYSRREGTTAARLPGQVDRASKRRRSLELRELAAEMKAEHLGEFAGTARTVLWEGEGEIMAAGTRRHFGYTDNYLRVVTEVAADRPSLENTVTVTELSLADGEATDCLRGKIL